MKSNRASYLEDGSLQTKQGVHDLSEVYLRDTVTVFGEGIVQESAECVKAPEHLTRKGHGH